MDREFTKTLIQSRTIVFLLAAAVTKIVNYLVAAYGLPVELPDDVRDEIVFAAQMGLEAFLWGCLGAAAWFRMKARAVIDKVF